MKYPPEDDDRPLHESALHFSPLVFKNLPWDYCLNCLFNLCAILWAFPSFHNAFSWTHIFQHQFAIWGHKMNWLAWWLVISMLIISNSHILFILSQTCFSPSAEIVYTSHFIFFIVNMQVNLVTAWQSTVRVMLFFLQCAS